MSLRRPSFGEIEFLQMTSMKRHISKSALVGELFYNSWSLLTKRMILQPLVFKLTFAVIFAASDLGVTETIFDANSSCTC